jgi:RNA-directed DNA polymerase
MPEEKIERLQSKLYTAAKSDPKRRFHSLRDKVYRRDILEQAWEDVKENRGTSGPDGISIWDIETSGVGKFLDELQRELRDGTYRPGPLLRVEIEKPGGGFRPLGIPNVRDRVAQAAVKLVIEPIFEADFKPCSYGYRPNKSTIDATKAVYMFLNFGLEHVIDVDIEHCFDEIPHARLIARVALRISDGYILKLISMWLKSPVLINGTLCSITKGTPQGGVISPLLANIYLHQLDTEWERLGMTRRQGPNAQMVRYADDIVILTDQSPRYPMRVLCRLLEDLGLRLSMKKSRIVEAHEGFDFLGFRFIRRYSRKHGKRKTYYFPSPRSIARAKEKILERSGNHVLHETPEEVSKSLNRFMIGWWNYYRHSNGSRALGKVVDYLLSRFCRYLRRRKNKSGLGNRHDLSRRAIADQYGLIVTYTVGTYYMN